jgi:GNAT superfamily N-acetyltransferase
MANDGEVTVRPIDFIRDEAPLKAFLVERDRVRLDHLEPAVQSGDCYAIVADEDGLAVGWAVVHTNFREDQDWNPPDDDTRRFQSGDNAYLENIEVAARMRGKGVGTALLQAVEQEARKRGKRHLWLHTSENNVMAHRVFDRAGWTHESSVYPPWKPSSRTRIYRKDL